MGKKQNSASKEPINPDQRMQWIRVLETLTTAKTRSYVIEAEIGSEVEIHGLLGYGGNSNNALMMQRITHYPDKDRLYKYVLSFRIPYWEAPMGKTMPIEKGTRKGYLFREGSIGEFIALFSLQLQVRLFILSTSHRSGGVHDIPTQKTEFVHLHGHKGTHIDSVVFSSGLERNLVSSLLPFLEKVQSLPEKYHLDFVVAADHYAKALQLIGIDEEMVFVKLVSAIERMAKELPVEDKFSGKTLDELILVEGIESDELEELRDIFSVRRAKTRFIAFLTRYSRGFFDCEAREPAHTQVTPENLSVIAGAIYDARSGYLHNGDPMYISVRLHQFPQWHMETAAGRTWQNRAFTQKQKLPNCEFFHRLVRYCLLARFDELTRSI